MYDVDCSQSSGMQFELQLKSVYVMSTMVEVRVFNFDHSRNQCIQCRLQSKSACNIDSGRSPCMQCRPRLKSMHAMSTAVEVFAYNVDCDQFSFLKYAFTFNMSEENQLMIEVSLRLLRYLASHEHHSK